MDLGDIVTTACLLCVRHWQLIAPMSLLTVAATLMTDVGLIPLVAKMPSAPGSSAPALPALPMVLAP